MLFRHPELADMLHGVDGAAASRQSSVANAGSLCVSLNGHRSERVATTLSGFPDIHWSVLTVLYLCVVLSFLLDSNQEINQYLNSIQVRVRFLSHSITNQFIVDGTLPLCSLYFCPVRMI